MRFRCPVCNGELSYCGPDGPDGPTVDCMLCKLRQERDEARQLARTLANGGALGGNWRDPYPWLREGGEA